MNQDSILAKLEQAGLPAPRVQLASETPVAAAEGSQRFRVLGEVARGAMGVVLLGHDNDLGRDVAIKVLHERHLDNRELLQRFVEEAQIGGQLQHPGVVPVYELGLEANDRPYFAMKLVKGQSLAKRLAERASPADGRREVLTVFRDVCRTMSYVHSRSVIHRDLKPGNVMIGGFGEVQIVDWGFAKILGAGGIADELLRSKAERDVAMISTVRSKDAGSASQVGSVMGTPAYMPPEQARGRIDELDERSDIFSLGAILCEILTGQPPYRGASDRALADAAEARLDDAWRALDACDGPEELVALCRSALSPVRKDRPASADRLADAVASWLTEVEGNAHRAELARVAAETDAEAARRARQNTRRLAAAIVLVLSIAVGSAVYVGRERAAREREKVSAIAETLDEVARLRATGEWAAAAGALDRALALGADPDALDGLRAGVRAAADAQRIAQEDSEFLERLEGVRANWGRMRADTGAGELASASLRDSAATDRAFAAAFEERFGGPAAAVERLRGSTLAPQFAANLVFWAWLQKAELESEAWREMAALGEAVDPRRAAVFEALFADDPDALATAVAAHELELDASTAAQVGLALAATPAHRAEARELLREALEREPGDFWLHTHYAQIALEDGDFVTARRHYTVALALQPKRTSTVLQLSRTYHDSESSHAADTERARVILRRAVEIAGDNAEGLAFAGGQLSNTEAYEEAEHVLSRATVLDARCAQAWQSLGITRIRLGRVDEGIADLRRASEVDPADAKSLDMVGYGLLQLGRVAEAERELRRALALGGPSALVRVNLASALARQSRDREARELAEAVLAEGLETPLQAGALAVTLATAGAKARALEVVEIALKAAPERPSVLSQAAIVHSSAGRGAEAQRFIERAIAAEPGNVKYRETLLRVLVESRQVERAIEEAERMSVAYPERALPLALGGQVRLATGDVAGARPMLERAVALDPFGAHAWSLLGQAHMRQSDFAGAAAAFRRGSELAPGDPDARLNLAAALAQGGELVEAEEYLRAALAEHPEEGSLHRVLAALLWHLGRRDEARSAVEAALRYEREDFQRLLELGRLLVSMGDGRRGRGVLLRAKDACGPGDDPQLMVDLGGALSNLGELQRAAELLEEAAGMAPRFLFVHRYLGITLGKLGRTDEAARAWARVVELAGDDARGRFSGALGLFSSGDAEGARRALASLPGDDPNRAAVLGYTALLDAADTIVSGGSVEMLPGLRATLAQHLLARGEPEAALAQFDLAFERDPQLFESLGAGHRLLAASAAARVGGSELVRALEGLRADLEEVEELADRQPELATTALERMLHDPALATLREGDGRPAGAAELFDAVRALRESIARAD